MSKGVVTHASNPSIQEAEDEDCHRFEASLIYTPNSRPAGATPQKYTHTYRHVRTHVYPTVSYT